MPVSNLQPPKTGRRRWEIALALCLALLQTGAVAQQSPSPSPDPTPLQPLAPKLAPVMDTKPATTGSQSQKPPAAAADKGKSAPTSAAQPATAPVAQKLPAGSAGKGTPGAKKAGETASVKKAGETASARQAGEKASAKKAGETASARKAGETASARKTQSAAQAAQSGVPPVAPSIEKYPKVGELETLMFGVAHPNIPLEYRLDRLESEVFHQTNPEWESKHRIERLQQTLIGGSAPAGTAFPSGSGPLGTQQPADTPAYVPPALPNTTMPSNGTGTAPYAAPYATPAIQEGYSLPQPNLDSPDMQRTLPKEQLEQYALDVINEAREHQGLGLLAWDDLGYKVAQELVSDLSKRNTVSHTNAAGDNPDVRYSKAGGSDCMLESLACVKQSGGPLNKAVVWKIIDELMSHQDDRDALMASHATSGAFALNWTASHDKLLAATEVITKQAELAPIPTEVKIGDKVDVKGVIKGPYKFQKITVAWEGLLPTNGDDVEEQQDEALPYFPPLDYAAFSKRSEHDYQKAVRILQIAGIGAAIAGGLFIPPVALAAPLIAASGSSVKPKAVSDIPVKGGVKVEGASFEDKIPLSKDSKEGIYYITVWASGDDESAPFAVSRRAVIVRAADKNLTASSSENVDLLTASSDKTASADKKEQKKQESNESK